MLHTIPQTDSGVVQALGEAVAGSPRLAALAVDATVVLAALAVLALVASALLRCARDRRARAAGRPGCVVALTARRRAARAA